MSEKIKAFWKDFTDQNPQFQNIEIPDSEYFGNTEEAANDIAQLIKSGKKTATCSAYIAYQLEKINIPEAGDLLIIVDWDENPVAVIKTTNVTIRKFKEIDAGWAKLEGEGDLSLEYWTKVHQEFFEMELGEYGLVPTEEMELVCEEFEVVGK